MSSFAVEEETKQKQKKTEPVKPVTAQPETVQRDLTDVNGPEGGMLPGEVSSRIQSMRGSGQRLSGKSLEHYSQKFGRDMSDVHVHTDAASDTISRSLNARAFTIGSDVFLTKGINPDAGSGRDAQTMTHELTHVVQQGGHASAGPLKLGAADTAQEHEAESTAQREFDPKLKEEDADVQRLYAASNTIQRGFWSSLGGAIGSKLLGAVGIGDAFNDFMSGDNKVKSAIKRMSRSDRANYTGVENDIKRLEDTEVPQAKKAASRAQKQLQQIAADPAQAAQLPAAQDAFNNANHELDTKTTSLQENLDRQLMLLQKSDNTITKSDVNKYRSGKGKLIVSSLFASIGGSILSNFETDPEKKAEARKNGISSINSWFASANKGEASQPDEAEEKESKEKQTAQELATRENAIVEQVWIDIQNLPDLQQVREKYPTKLLYKREVSRSCKDLIQESMKDPGVTDLEIKDSVKAILKSSAQPAQGNGNGGGV